MASTTVTHWSGIRLVSNRLTICRLETAVASRSACTPLRLTYPILFHRVFNIDSIEIGSPPTDGQVRLLDIRSTLTNVLEKMMASSILTHWLFVSLVLDRLTVCKRQTALESSLAGTSLRLTDCRFTSNKVLDEEMVSMTLTHWSGVPFGGPQSDYC